VPGQAGGWGVALAIDGDDIAADQEKDLWHGEHLSEDRNLHELGVNRTNSGPDVQKGPPVCCRNQRSADEIASCTGASATK
jgi:hypothetical protein